MVAGELTQRTPQAGSHRLLTSPLLAVCGLCGGAGASTLAYLVAHEHSTREQRPTLVCDTGGLTAGLAVYARIESPRSLPAAAGAVARGEPLGEGLFADAGRGLRVIAGAPELGSDCERGALTRVLRDARGAHALTVVDCGTLGRPADREALVCASHVAWILPATRSGVRRAARVLAALPPVPAASELVVARADAAGSSPPLNELAALAAQRRAPLVLMPHVPDLAEQPVNEVTSEAAGALQAIKGILER